MVNFYLEYIVINKSKVSRFISATKSEFSYGNITRSITEISIPQGYNEANNVE